MTEIEVIYTLTLLHEEHGQCQEGLQLQVIKFNSVWLPLDNLGNDTLYPEQLHCDI